MNKPENLSVYHKQPFTGWTEILINLTFYKKGSDESK